VDIGHLSSQLKRNGRYIIVIMDNNLLLTLTKEVVLVGFGSWLAFHAGKQLLLWVIGKGTLKIMLMNATLESHISCVTTILSVPLMVKRCGQRLNKKRFCHLTTKEAREGLSNLGSENLMNMVVG